MWLKSIYCSKKGFSVGKAAAGAILTGGVGLAAGAIGSNKVLITCLACGNSWDPKQLHNQNKRAENNKAVAAIQDRNRKKEEWKTSWYKQYEKGNYDRALEIFTSEKTFGGWKVPDIHEAYARYKKKDRRNIITIAIVAILIVFIVYLIAR